MDLLNIATNNELQFSMESEVRPWGRWTILNEGPSYKVKLIEVWPGHRLSLQFHRHRTEHWLVVSGTAKITVADQHQELGVLQSAIIPQQTIHRIENTTTDPLLIIEAQVGGDLSEEDIVRLDDDYEREVRAGGFDS